MRPTVAEILSDQVSLGVRCLDRIYVNGYLPRLQTTGQLTYFLGEHRGNPIASPALLGQMGDRYRAEVAAFIESEGVELVRFARGERKDDVAERFRRQHGEREGVVFVGVAQERASSYRGSKQIGEHGQISFQFSRCSVYVNHYYFYLWDREWGPAFIKIGTYVPYPVKLCLNGHEWAKQQLRRESIAFESLDNGFFSCQDPGRLQQVCDQLGPDAIAEFFARWRSRLPWPLSVADGKAGFCHQLSLWQLEISHTQVFKQPQMGRRFFDLVIQHNLDLGRPDRLRLLFPKNFVTRRTPPPRFGFRTRVFTAGVRPSLHADYKLCHVKQYLKEGRALRTETTINEPRDFCIGKALGNLWRLRALGHRINQRLLETETVAEDCCLALPEFETLNQPMRNSRGQRLSALRFGDPRAMALLSALCRFSLQINGFRNRDLRTLIQDLLARPYGSREMSYDLRRLRLRGLIQRIDGTHRYLVTPLGLRVAFLFNAISQRLLRPAWAALLPSSTTQPKLSRAVDTIDRHLAHLHENARLRSAA